MARSQHPDSAGSQLFIVTKNALNLDKNYAAFGKATKGMDIVEDINNVEVGDMDKPVNNILIESISVDTKGVEYPDAVKIK
jgi:peptidyl-prolyl cis-trans isomerase B (cyclophilin B)